MLERVTQLASDLAALEVKREELHAAIRAAVTSGEPAAAVARAAGISRQRVYQLVASGESRRTVVERRLSEIDGRYDELVDRIASGFTATDAKAITAARNAQAGKRARKGLGRLPTVKEEARRLAETQLLRVLSHRCDDPGIRRVQLELDEAALLREELDSLTDADRGF